MMYGCDIKIVIKCLLYLALVPPNSAFQLAGNANTNTVDIYSDVSINCDTNGGDNTCNDETCPTRTNTSHAGAILKDKPAECKVLESTITPPLTGGSDSENGYAVFNETTTECTKLVKDNLRTDPDSFFTYSGFFKAECTSKCNIFQIGDDITLSFTPTGGITLNTEIVYTDSIADWTAITIRYNGQLHWTIGSNSGSSTMSPPPQAITVTFGPDRNLTTGEIIKILDARWYSEMLTDREIKAVIDGTNLPSDCRCPAAYPTKFENNKINFLKCTNGTEEVMRYHSNAYYYMIDDDISTAWTSNSVTDHVTVTLKLKKVYQIKKIEITGIPETAKKVTIKLMQDNTRVVREMSFMASCDTFDGTCTDLTGHFTGGNFLYDFESGVDFTSNNTALVSMVASSVVVDIYTAADLHFTIRELQLDVRCHCSGNDGSCVIASDGTYTCTCMASSNTNGDHCYTCVDGYYSNKDSLVCDLDCYCNLTGSLNTRCEKDTGQCSCKPNVDSNEGRQCTACEFNSVNFTSTGCTKCLCNKNGITNCKNDLTCVCKKNVESDTGRCAACLADHYGLTQPYGCTHCDCNLHGSNASQCHIDTGKCSCKRFVQGKTCTECQDGYHSLGPAPPYGCLNCKCNFFGSFNQTCVKDGTDKGKCPCRDASSNNIQCIPSDLVLEPDYGPQAGGTLLTISGHNLGDGNVKIIEFKINNKDQTIVSSNSTSIVIKTDPASSSERLNISLYWAYQGEDYHDKAFESRTTFKYKDNPTINVPKTSYTSYASGGCSIPIEGKNLASVPKPRYVVYTGDTKQETICHHKSNTSITCKTPNVAMHTTEGNLAYGIILDNILDYRNLTNTDDIMLHVVPDPVITDWDREFRNVFDKELQFSGSRLGAACTDEDIRIVLHGNDCRFLTRTSDKMTCDPQEDFPGKTMNVNVSVQIGDLWLHVGIVRFISFWETNEFMYIAIGCGAFVLLVIAIVICCCIRRYRRDDENLASGFELSPAAVPNPYIKDPTKHPNHMTDVIPNNTNVNSSFNKHKPFRPDSVCYRQDFIDRLQHSEVKSSFIERSHIEPGKHCTQKGKYARVINGKFTSTSSSPGTSLTIKTLVDRYPESGDLPTWLTNGLKECIRLRDYNNTNVLRLLGIAVDDKYIYVVYPEMKNRTLKDYLLKAQNPFQDSYKLDVCVQVAEGMNYLDAQHVVHKDLAARNCWMDNNDGVKISDSSFMYDLYPEEYLYQHNGYVPVRWMAPESLRQAGFYHSKSDIWSFGVLVWEVFTNGRYLPYYDISNTDVKTQVCDRGYRLGKPHDCADNIFSVIEKCHVDSHDERPNFFVLLNILTDIISPGGDQPVSYANEAFQGEEDYMNLQINATNAPPPRPARTVKR